MFENSIIFLTGATGKLGRELAHGFSAEGCTLVLPVRSSKLVSEGLKDECMQKGARHVEIIPIDLISENAIIEICGELARLSLYPNVLINNARNREYLKADEHGYMCRENWLNEYLLDVVLPYELAIALVNMENTKLRKIINVCSIYGVTAPNMRLYKKPEDSPINYGVSKAALIHLTKELAVRLAGQQVEVNAISYGGIGGRVDPEFQQSYEQLCPANRMLSHEDVFEPLKFLASQKLTGMTGHNLIIDGGWTIW